MNAIFMAAGFGDVSGNSELLKKKWKVVMCNLYGARYDF